MAIVAYPAGMLRHSLTVESLTVARVTGGTGTHTWTPDPIARGASIRQLSGREQLEANQLQADVTHEVKMRYYRGLTPTHRLTWGQRVFNIVSVDNVEEANVNHKLRCMEMAPKE